MGGGFAGNAQARHLKLRMPDLRVAVIDRRTEEKLETDRKVGESLIEISSLFLMQELKLHEYLIEKHRPKHGLNFHWPRDPNKTGRLDDYWSIWSPYLGHVGTFQIQRSVLERDLLQMNRELGVDVLRGVVKDVELRPAGAHRVCVAGDELDGVTEIECDYLIDASGRRQILGKKFDNILRGPEHFGGLNSGASWIRVRKPDRSFFDSDGGPPGTLNCKYYGTNHFFGKGHWCWMIPLLDDELSIGMVHHHQVIDNRTVNTRDGLMAFLERYHQMLYRMVCSGEPVDFRTFKRLPFKSKRYISPDRWAVVGDAAAFLDPFYSPALAITSLQIEQNTAVVEQRHAGRPIEDLAEDYNWFMQDFVSQSTALYRNHHRHLGHASAMAWRMYIEFLRYSGQLLPLYMGKYHLDRSFIKQARLAGNMHGPFDELLHKTLDDLIASGKNAGFPDSYQHDHYMLGMSPVWHGYVERREFEPGTVNLAFSAGWASMTAMRGLATLTRRTYGAKGLLRLAHLGVQARSALVTGVGFAGGLVHRLSNLRQPRNAFLANTARDFRSYRFDDSAYQTAFYHRSSPEGDSGADSRSDASSSTPLAAQ
ncbi:MAG: tryptophan halogenase [Myxococcota bacterium]